MTHKLLILTLLVASLLLVACGPTATAVPAIRQAAETGLSERQATTLNSLEKVDDYPLYTMHFYGSSETSWASPEDGHELANANLPSTWACSLFAAMGDASKFYGRNFDWDFSPALLLFTHPTKGYTSVSMVDMAYLGVDDKARTLTELPLDQRRALLQAPALPFDGMNEHGLVVGMAAVSSGNMQPDPSKQTIDSLRVIRKMLDQASNVDEALAILQRYNIDWGGGPPLHYLIASGIQVDRAQKDNRQVVTVAAGPARDFYMAASDLFAVVSETVGATKVNSYAFKDRTEGSRAALRTAVNAIKSYSAHFGAYPYTEFDVVSTPMQGATGIEYPGITGINYAVYDPKATVSGIPAPIMLESTVAHEVGHQWFYNVVGDDQINEPWLDEAVTQYVTGLYFLDLYGQQGMEGYRNSWLSRWDRVNREPIPIGLPASSYQGKEYGAIVYGRGPLFIEALAQKMGQATFDQFLRDYYQSHKWGIGTAASFKQFADKHCQCDLTPVFDEWVYKK